MIDVITIFTPSYKSNSYLLRDQELKQSIVIDPTIQSFQKIADFIDKGSLSLNFLLPTHGHFDHIEGIDLLRNKFGGKVIANHECSIAFQNPKKNYSCYFENRNIIIDLPDIVIGYENYNFKWNNTEIKIIKTPGHSPCSVCIAIDDKFLFSGDTVLLEYNPFSKFPDADASALQNSIRTIYSNYSPNLVVYPGHGAPFNLGTARSKFAFLKSDINS